MSGKRFVQCYLMTNIFFRKKKGGILCSLDAVLLSPHSKNHFIELVTKIELNLLFCRTELTVPNVLKVVPEDYTAHIHGENERKCNNGQITKRRLVTACMKACNKTHRNVGFDLAAFASRVTPSYQPSYARSLEAVRTFSPAYHVNDTKLHPTIHSPRIRWDTQLLALQKN